MENLVPSGDFNETKRIHFGKVISLSDSATRIKYMPFPMRRMLHWVSRIRNANGDVQSPLKIVISQEMLIAINNHVSQSVATEMGGFMLGNRYWDPKTRGEFIIIDQYVEAPTVQATSVSFTFTDAAWKQMDENLAVKFNGKALVGWYHSHPHLGVFLSGDDLTIHKERFNEPWMVALVIDPKNRRGGFFSWSDGNIDMRNPVDFYEQLSDETVIAKQSASPWTNYICLDEETNTYYEPPRLKAATSPVRGTPPNSLLPKLFRMASGSFNLHQSKGMQPFALLAILLAAIIISAVILITQTRKPTEQAQVPPQTLPQPLEDNLTAGKVDLNSMGLTRKSVNTYVASKGRKKRAIDTLTQVILVPKNTPANCSVTAESLRKQYPTVSMNDRLANTTYDCPKDNLEVAVTAQLPQQRGSKRDITIEFKDAEGKSYVKDIDRTIESRTRYLPTRSKPVQAAPPSSAAPPSVAPAQGPNPQSPPPVVKPPDQNSGQRPQGGSGAGATPDTQRRPFALMNMYSDDCERIRDRNFRSSETYEEDYTPKKKGKKKLFFRVCGAVSNFFKLD